MGRSAFAAARNSEGSARMRPAKNGLQQGVDNHGRSARVTRSKLSVTEKTMPNTKSAERRMRNSARKQLHNRSTATRLHSLEKKYVLSIASGKKDAATTAFQLVVSAWDKAAKTG